MNGNCERQSRPYGGDGYAGVRVRPRSLCDHHQARLTARYVHGHAVVHYEHDSLSVTLRYPLSEKEHIVRNTGHRQPGGITTVVQVVIAACVFLLIVTGGFGVANNFDFIDLRQWHIGEQGDQTDIILGGIAITVGLSILVWRRVTGGVSTRWSQEILGIRSIDDIYLMSPQRFEQFVAFLFQHRSYVDVRVVGQTGDQGIDIEMRQHTAQGLVRIVAQCKRYKGSIGQPIVREFYGSYANHAAEGFLVTTALFTQPAREWAAHRPIRLIDGTTLLQWTEQVAQQLHASGVPHPIVTP